MVVVVAVIVAVCSKVAGSVGPTGPPQFSPGVSRRETMCTRCNCIDRNRGPELARCRTECSNVVRTYVVRSGSCWPIALPGWLAPGLGIREVQRADIVQRLEL